GRCRSRPFGTREGRTLSAMDEKLTSRRAKLLAEAEGYLALGMHTHALASLDAIERGEDGAFAANFLRGEALRNLERHADALEAFQHAFDEKPDDVSLLMAMAWCYKRTNQLPRAITSMEQ